MGAPKSIIKSYVSNLEGWVEGCEKHHGDKRQAEAIARRPPHHIPDLFIDPEDGCIVRKSSFPKYVALSYVRSPVVKDV